MTITYDATEHAKQLIRYDGECNINLPSCHLCFIETELHEDVDNCSMESAVRHARKFLDLNDKCNSIWGRHYNGNF